MKQYPDTVEKTVDDVVTLPFYPYWLCDRVTPSVVLLLHRLGCIDALESERQKYPDVQTINKKMDYLDHIFVRKQTLNSYCMRPHQMTSLR